MIYTCQVFVVHDAVDRRVHKYPDNPLRSLALVSPNRSLDNGGTLKAFWCSQTRATLGIACLSIGTHDWPMRHCFFNCFHQAMLK